MRCSFWALLLVLACSACAPKAKDAAEVAGRTAKLYYDALLEGKYDVFVAGIDKHLGEQHDYDVQLLANARMFVDKQKDSHQGIASFEVSRVEYSDSAYAANVFLQVHYADSTQEQIVVPMVVRDDVWLMR